MLESDQNRKSKYLYPDKKHIYVKIKTTKNTSL